MTSPLVISHRTNQGSMPENTLIGIGAAIEDGADAVEVDVRGTWDGVPVLMHDASLRRTTGDGRALGLVRFAELRDVRVHDPSGRAAPQPVPTLAEALRYAGGRIDVVLDVCERGLEAGIVAAVRAADAEAWTWVTTHDVAEAQRLASLLPRSRVLLSVGRRSGALPPMSAVTVAAATGLDGVNPDHRLLTPALVDAAHARRLWVSTWTVDAPGDIDRVLRAGVDSVCGNYPSRLIDARRGSSARRDAPPEGPTKPASDEG